MELGALLPFGDIGGDAAVLREYAQAAEAIGYDFIEAPDHVLGQNPAGQSAGERIADGLYHDPFVLFGYLAGICPKLGFSTGVLILPQRQTVLVAKQAACLDVLCGGRFHLGIGVWVSMGSGSDADWAKEARFWKQAGATHLCLTTTFNRRHHKRISGHTLSDHIGALRRFHATVAGAL